MRLAVIVLTLMMTFFNGYLYLYILQRENYRADGVLNRSQKLIVFDLIAFLLSFASLLVAWTVFGNSNWKGLFYVLAYMPPLGVVVYKSARYFDAKVIFTNRMLRLIALFLSIALLLSLSCYIWISLTSVLPLIILFSLPLMLLSNTIITPLEKRNNQKYIVSAKAKLSKPDLIKIGITGSYGKTSVKEILKVILAKKYKVAVTAGNFNTPLGIAKTVNAMDSGCEVFIAEMGARRSGDIEELVSFVKPDIGVLTGIAEQHTETFINLQSIIKEKRKLIDYTKTAVINAENEIIRDNCADSNFIKIRFEDGGDLNIRNAYCDKRGGRFSLEFGGEVLTLSTQLLGRHNILNIALAVAVALKLNVSSQLIQAAVEELEPLPHRQQKILTEKGITIIDDSYNINSEGVRAALDTLDMFGGRKIVAVSGFVEMGDKEKEYNYLLGEWISEVADIIIVLDDKFKNDIISGALRHIGRSSILTVKNLEDCKKLYSELLQKGDILLILADLPPNYLI